MEIVSHWNYVYPEDLSSAQDDTPISVDIMELYTDLFEEYPHADENTDMPSLDGVVGWNTLRFPLWEVFSGLIAHEMAHQWLAIK